MGNERILFVENQEFQFKSIFEFLEGKYQVLPSIVDYVKFIDNVRVWVNEKYEVQYREIACLNLLNFIEQNDIKLILMDYKLGGAQYCMVGTDLAKELNARRMKEGKNSLPVLFISKTEHTLKKRLENFEEYQSIYPNTKWIHKGYFGEEFFNSEYIEKFVVTEIDKMLATNKGKSTLEELKEFISRKEPLRHLTGQTHKQKSLILLDRLYLYLETSPFNEETEIKVREILKKEIDLGEKTFNIVVEEILYKK